MITGPARALAALTILTFGLDAGQAAEDEPFARTELWIESGAERIRFEVEVAQTTRQRTRGLMFRKELPQLGGMLFDYKKPVNVAMWMKNTFIPLDMLFVADNGIIVRIAENTTPLSLESIHSGAPVKAVIELSGGITGRLGIRAGDRVVHPIFETE
ncbi:MAG: DUF192 domain-containing protein [Alphaproteobacteria bacterium]|jgi:hypothetical protein|nr:DUF192 domain-containing protein [Alphaproteobacteria bacterium]MDP6516971.1 DUF192 domain-containing protein [Alphaproteobacteria bacterium]